MLLLLLLELFPLFADEDSVGVCLMCEDFDPELVVFVVELVVLLFDDDVPLEPLPVLVVDEEFVEDFELLRLEDVLDDDC